MTHETLAALRPGLLAYCRKLKSDPADAEDLAQDTLVIALQQAQAGKQVADWPRWLAGIARMRARHALPSSRTLVEEMVSLDVDPLDSLLLRERGSLLESAFRQLDTPTRQLLTQRYLEDTSVTEIAAILGLSENTASQRLLRARQALESVLAQRTPEAAAAHGLISPLAADGWTPTTIRCPRCAEAMQGQLTQDSLRLLCPQCDISSQREGLIGLSTAANSLPAPTVLSEARGFRVALKRVNAWWNEYLINGLQTGKVRCQGCGRQVPVQTQTSQGQIGFYTQCDCGSPFFVHPAGLLLHDDAGQAFWREEEKIRFSAPQRIVCGGRDALLVRYTSTRSAALLEAIYAADTLERLELHKK